MISIGEIAIRMFLSDASHIQNYAAMRNYLSENANNAISIGNVTRTVNSYGFADHEPFISKTGDRVRIAVIGDSFTFGLGNKINETFPKLLEDTLGYGDGKYEVLNLGIPGANTFEESKMLYFVHKEFQPDIIIIAFFGNDIIAPFEAEEEICYKRGKFSTSRLAGRLKMNLIYLFNAFNNVSVDKNYAEILFDNEIGWSCFDYALSEIKKFSEEQKQALVFVVIPDAPDPANLYLANRAKRLFEKKDLDYFDLQPYFKYEENNSYWNSFGHYNYKANLIIAKEIASFLEENYTSSMRLD